jgi:hypothetical protein
VSAAFAHNAVTAHAGQLSEHGLFPAAGSASSNHVPYLLLPTSSGAIIVLSQMEAVMSLEPGDADPSQSYGGESQSVAPAGRVTFDRRELDRIFRLYGRKVAAGEWRDYAIDFLRDRAVFSVFRRSSEVPIYRIEKNPKLARKQGAYSVISATGLIVRRGQELDRVLSSIDKSLRVVA